MKRYLITFLTMLALGGAQAATLSVDLGVIPCPRPTPDAPVWEKLVVSGNSVTCYYARSRERPSLWTKIGPSETINFINNPVLVGLAICSHNRGALSTGTVDHFAIHPTPSYRLADTDIGAPAYMGSANLIDGVWNLAGGGWDIWANSDQFNFQPWLVSGDCTVVCRVTSLSAGDPWEKIGIMVRDGYNSGSDYAMCCATGGAGVSFIARPTFNNNPDATQLVAPPAPGVISNIAVGYSLSGPTAYVVRP